MKKILLVLPLAAVLGATSGMALTPGPALALADVAPQKEQPDGSTKCPVTGLVLAKGKGVKVEVMGHAYRVADDAAAKELQEHPEKYLKADGTPKNQGVLPKSQE